jgi:membrane protease YdiL (CAAX protease family)
VWLAPRDEAMSQSRSHATGEEQVTFRGALPGLVFVLVLEATYWLGGSAARAWLLAHAWSWLILFVGIPVAYLLASRQGAGALGYHRRLGLSWYARGFALGALWRLVDVATNHWRLFRLSSQVRPGNLAGSLLGALVVVPLLEETFFRGYLQPGLAARWGPVLAVFIQALLFAFHPLHAVQGWSALPSIFLFGLLAGVLYGYSRSIWSVWGAHGAGNVLPAVVRLAARWWWG